MDNLTPAPTPPPPPAEAPENGGFPFATWGPWIAIGATVFALIAGLLLSLPVLAIDGGADTEDLSLLATVVVQICTGIGFVIVPLMLAMSGGASIRQGFSRLGFQPFEIRSSAKWAGIGILSYFAFAILYSLVIGTPEQDDIAADFGPIPVQILLIVIVAPPVEEVCFRGMLFGGIRKKFPLWVAAPAAGVVFGLPHFSTGWSAVPSLIVLGIILAVVYEKTRSLWPVIGMHAFNNGLALIVLNS